MLLATGGLVAGTRLGFVAHALDRGGHRGGARGGRNADRRPFGPILLDDEGHSARRGDRHGLLVLRLVGPARAATAPYSGGGRSSAAAVAVHAVQRRDRPVRHGTAAALAGQRRRSSGGLRSAESADGPAGRDAESGRPGRLARLPRGAPG